MKKVVKINAKSSTFLTRTRNRNTPQDILEKFSNDEEELGMSC